MAGIGWHLRKEALGHTRTVTKDYQALYTALTDAGMDTSALDELYNNGSYDDRTRQLFELADKWYDNASSDQSVALGAIQAMLKNQLYVENGNMPTGSDYPQVLANYVSYKWGVGSKQWLGLQKIRSSQGGEQTLEWCYWKWAGIANGSFNDSVLSGWLCDPSSIPAASARAQLPSPPTDPYFVPPWGPPQPPSMKAPDLGPEASAPVTLPGVIWVLVGFTVVLVGVTAYGRIEG